MRRRYSSGGWGRPPAAADEQACYSTSFSFEMCPAVRLRVPGWAGRATIAPSLAQAGCGCGGGGGGGGGRGRKK